MKTENNYISHQKRPQVGDLAVHSNGGTPFGSVVMLISMIHKNKSIVAKCLRHEHEYYQGREMTFKYTDILLNYCPLNSGKVEKK